MLPAAIGISVGILFDNGLAVPAWWYAVAFAAVIVVFLCPLASDRLERRQRWALALTLIAAGCVGGLSHQVSFRRLPPNHVAFHTAEQPLVARLRGRVLTEPRVYQRSNPPFEQWSYQPYRTSFLVEAESLASGKGAVAVSGRVRVTVKEAVLVLSQGGRVELFGDLYRPLSPSNPGSFDWGLRDRRKGIYAGMSCKHAECVRRLEPADTHGWRATWASVRRHLRGLLLGDLLHHGGEEQGGSAAASLLDAMVLGRRGSIDQQLNDAFIQAGCAHFLAVSGMHVCMLGAFFWIAGRVVGLTERGCAVLTLTVTVAYAGIVEPRPPILRAATMTMLWCVSLLVRRRGNTLNTLALAATVLLCWQPTALFGPGFQLSFAAVLGVVCLAPVLNQAACRAPESVRRLLHLPQLGSLKERRRKRRGLLQTVARWVCGAVCVSVSAWAATAPLVMIHFGRVSLWGWLNTLFMLPLVYAVMLSSFAKLLCGLALPRTATFLSPVVECSAELLGSWVGVLGRMPGASIQVPPLPWWLAVMCYLMLASWFQAGRQPDKPAEAAWRFWRRASRAATGGFAVAVALWLMWPNPSRHELTMTVLSVGRGTSVVLELPGGQALLYDAGASGSYDPGKSTILPYLRHRSVSRLDGVFVSHPNLDHFGGLVSVVDGIPTGPVMVPPQFEPLSHAGAPSSVLLVKLRSREQKIKSLSSDEPAMQFGDVTIEVLWPPAEPPFELDANDSSLVLRVRYADRSILLTGDIEQAPQRWLTQYADIAADVLLLPHHGSVEPATQAFVEAVGPQYVICSTSQRTGAKSNRLLALLGDRPYFNTADVGAVTVTIGDAGICVQGYQETRADR